MVEATSFGTSTPARDRLLHVVLMAALMACALWAALIEAPAMRASAHQQRDREINVENPRFCEKLGLRAGTSEFLACTS